MDTGGARRIGIPVLLMLLAAAIPAFPAPDHALKIATSIHPLASIISEIAGDRADVVTIVPAGADPHHFELTPRVARALHEADLVFIIGGHFDRWAVRGLIDGGPAKVCEFHVAFEDSLLPMGDSFNPHFWLDPFFAEAMGMIVNVALGAIDAQNAHYYQERTAAFRSGIDSLHLSTRQRIMQTRLTQFVALHPAWSYFARRYGLREIATIEVSHEQEPSPRHVTHVISQMRKLGAWFVFAEEFSNPDLAEAVASETGAEIIFLDPLGHADKQDRDSYFELINYNVSLIEKAAGASTGR